MKIDLDKIVLKINYGYYAGEESISVCYNSMFVAEITWTTTVKAIIEIVEKHLKERKELAKLETK